MTTVGFEESRQMQSRRKTAGKAVEIFWSDLGPAAVRRIHCLLFSCNIILVEHLTGQ